jgi:hypothetical protein
MNPSNNYSPEFFYPSTLPEQHGYPSSTTDYNSMFLMGGQGSNSPMLYNNAPYPPPVPKKMANCILNYAVSTYLTMLQ